MILGNSGACDLVGFPLRHGTIFQEVANQLDVIIMSRAVGKSCTKLIEEGYGLKGFRIDTKSCSWGPMMGMVCVDPRLNKEGRAMVDFNIEKTHEALSGEIPAALSRPGPGEAAGWVADVVPMAISGARMRQLIAGVDGKRLMPIVEGADFLRGVAEHRGEAGNVRLPWVLIRLPVGRDARYGNIEGEVWGIFADTGFKQMFPHPSIRSIWREHNGKHYSALLGMANPGSGVHGYKACVTGDYDLFAVWPKKAAQGHAMNRPTQTEIRAHMAQRPDLVTRGARIRENWDARPVATGQREHFLLGNITKRLNVVKVMLNTRLQSDSEIKCGQAVHHSDEAGNPNVQLQKSLTKSLPVIAFVPNQAKAGPIGETKMSELSAMQSMLGRLKMITAGGAVGLETIDDLKLFARDGMALGFALDLRADWYAQLNL